MSHSKHVTTLDLHGRRLDEAISDVTLFLERIRRTVAPSSGGALVGRQNILFVTIITGSGSHSTHGPVLRDAVQRLLEKRGMVFSLQRGGGAFHVDALSGFDLYDPGPATDSKVLLTEPAEFHRFALSRRRYNVDNFAQSLRNGSHLALSSRGSSPRSSNRRSSSDPLPSQVASNDTDIRAAMELSISESQQRQNKQDRLNKEYQRQYQCAVLGRKIDNTAPKRISDESEFVNDESMLKLAYEKSIVDEKLRQQLTSNEYEDALMRAVEQSAQDSQSCDIASEDDLIQQALDESRALAEAEKANNCNGGLASDDDLIQQALDESRALAEAEQANSCNDDILEKVLAESVLSEERRKERQNGPLHEMQSNNSEEEEVLKEVMKLSLKEQETMAEEKAMKEVIEMSRHTF